MGFPKAVEVHRAACLPRFVHEAIEEGTTFEGAAVGTVGEAESTLLALEDALTPCKGNTELTSGHRLLLDRIMHTVESPRHRYAPFYARVAKLFALDDAAVIDPFERFSQQLAPGGLATEVGAHRRAIRRVPVTTGARLPAAHAELVWLSMGQHRLLCERKARVRTLVLDSSFEARRRLACHAGQLFEAEAALEHPFTVVCDSGCVLALVSDLPVLHWDNR